MPSAVPRRSDGVDSCHHETRPMYRVAPFTYHPVPSALSQAHHRVGIRPAIPRRSAEGAPINGCRGFPVAFRLPALASWDPVPPRSYAPLAIGLPNNATGTCVLPGPRRGFRFPHTRAATGLGALATPRPCVLHSRATHPAAARSLCREPGPTTLSSSHLPGLFITRPSRVHLTFTRPVFSGPVAPGWIRCPVRRIPRASHPIDQEPAAHAKVGDGRSSTHPERHFGTYDTETSSASSSLDMCDRRRTVAMKKVSAGDPLALDECADEPLPLPGDRLRSLMSVTYQLHQPQRRQRRDARPASRRGGVRVPRGSGAVLHVEKRPVALEEESRRTRPAHGPGRLPAAVFIGEPRCRAGTGVGSSGTRWRGRRPTSSRCRWP